MPGTFEQRIATIEGKARLLTERYHVVTAQRDAAIERVNALQLELDSCRKRIEVLTARVEYLQLAATIEPSRENLDRSRRFLSELVWEIDKCINQLSE